MSRSWTGLESVHSEPLLDGVRESVVSIGLLALQKHRSVAAGARALNPLAYQGPEPGEFTAHYLVGLFIVFTSGLITILFHV